MRQPLELNPLEAAGKPQRGHIEQIVDLDEVDCFQFGEAPEKIEVQWLAEAKKQRLPR